MGRIVTLCCLSAFSLALSGNFVAAAPQVAGLVHALGEWQESQAHTDDVSTPRRLEEKEEDDDTTTAVPMAGQSPETIFHHLTHALQEQLRSANYQWMNALIAFVLGGIMLFDGQSTFKALLVAVVFLLTAVVAASDLASALPAVGEGATGLVLKLTAAGVGAVGAYTAWLGIDGLEVIFGALFGGAVATYVKRWLVFMRASVFEEKAWLVVCLYTLFIGMALVWFRRKKHAKTVAAISALAGGSAVASVIAWSVTTLVAKGHLHFIAATFRGISPVAAPWVDFLLLQWVPTTDDVGLFAGSRFNLELHGQEWRTDRLAGVVLALALAIPGAMAQTKKLKGEATKVVAREMVASAGALGRALLTEEA